MASQQMPNRASPSILASGHILHPEADTVVRGCGRLLRNTEVYISSGVGVYEQWKHSNWTETPIPRG